MVRIQKRSQYQKCVRLRWPACGSSGTEGNQLLGAWDSATQTAPKLLVKLMLGSEQTCTSKPLPSTPTRTAIPAAPCGQGDLSSRLCVSLARMRRTIVPGQGGDCRRSRFEWPGHQGAALTGRAWDEYRVGLQQGTGKAPSSQLSARNTGAGMVRCDRRYNTCGG